MCGEAVGKFPIPCKAKIHIAIWCLTSWPAWFEPYYIFLHRMVHNVSTVLSMQILHLKDFLFFKCLPSSHHLNLLSLYSLFCLKSQKVIAVDMCHMRLHWSYLKATEFKRPNWFVWQFRSGVNGKNNFVVHRKK